MRASFLLAALACSGAVLATASPLRGLLLDAATGRPIEYATVSAYADSLLVDGTVTDADGTFILDLERGDYRLVFEFLGYASLDTLVALNGATDLGTVYLGAEGVDLESVEVRAERSRMELSLDKKVFNVGKDALARGGSANQVLEQLPSVRVTPDGAVSLRGNAGVRVLINGRPSALANNNALDAIPAEHIERVEIITNPSARYEAAGTAGIINIILKQDTDKGYGGTASLSTGYRADHRGNLSLNVRRPAWSGFLNLGGRYSNYLGTSNIRRELTIPEPLSIRNDLRIERNDRAVSVFTGLDYNLNPTTTLTGSYSLYHVVNDDVYTTDFTVLGPSATERWDQDFDYLEPGTYHQLDLTLTGELGERGKYTVYAKNDLWNELETEDTRLTATDGGTLVDYRNRSRESSRDHLLQADYEQALGKEGKLELGLRGETRVIRSDYLALDRTSDPPQVIAGFDNQFDFYERIGAAYGQYAREGEKLGYQLGLRYEYTRIATENRDEQQRDLDKQYHQLFPSLSVSYALAEPTKLQLSYSRRIRRPYFGQLSPFAGIVDPTRLQTGNPDLDPAYTHRAELGLLYRSDKLTLGPAVYASRTTGVLFGVFEQLSGNPFGLAQGTFLSRVINLDREDRLGLELTYGYRPSEVVTINGDLNFYGFRQADDSEALALDVSQSSWTAGLQPQLSLEGDWQLQLNLGYEAPVRQAQFTTLASYVTDLAVTKRWAEAWQVSLNVRSPRFRNWETRTEGAFQAEDFVWTQWRTGVTLTYRFERGAGAEERRQRGSIR